MDYSELSTKELQRIWVGLSAFYRRKIVLVERLNKYMANNSAQDFESADEEESIEGTKEESSSKSEIKSHIQNKTMTINNNFVLKI